MKKIKNNILGKNKKYIKNNILNIIMKETYI